MDVIISFFRDFLSGPLYIVVVIISAIGILACIGYLAEATLKQKELEKKQKEMYAEVYFLPADDVHNTNIVSNTGMMNTSTQVVQNDTSVATNGSQADTVVSNDMTVEVIGDSSSASNVTSVQPKQDDVLSDEQQQ